MANVDENISRFMNAKERARKLIQMDANGTLDEVKKMLNQVVNYHIQMKV
jgi:hypothetical protein